MVTRIRIASLDDVKDIVEVYCSSISRWIRYINGREVEARYDDLTIAERWSHGGPWMSTETCAIHINNLLVNNQYPLVAEFDGKIVGELELYIGEEKGIIGKCGHIDVLEVHKNYRRRGIGKALVNKAIEIAKEHECDTVAVWPAKEAVEFYRKCGISRIAYNIVHVEIGLNKINIEIQEQYSTTSFPNNYDAIKNMEFVSPRILSSFTTWIKSRWNYAIEKNRILSIEGYIPELKACYIVEGLWSNRTAAKLLLWIDDVMRLEQVLNEIFRTTKEKKIAKLHLLVDKNIYQGIVKKYPHKILTHEILLMKKIR